MAESKTPKNVESKFQFVILAAKRARQLLKGAKPKIKTKSRNPIRIAQQEIKMGVIDFDRLAAASEELEPREQLLLSEEEEELEGLPPLSRVNEEEEEEREEDEEKLDRIYETEEEEGEEEEPEEED